MENHEKVEDPGDPYPTHRDDFVWKNSTQWLRAKVKTINKDFVLSKKCQVIDDDCEGLWRIHDDLYDLTGWQKNHPGW